MLTMKPAKAPKTLPQPENPTLPPPVPEPQPDPVPATDFGSPKSEGPAADTSHLDGLNVAEPAGTAEPEVLPSGVQMENGFIPMPAFTATLGMTFTLGGGLLGLKTLTEAPGQSTYPAAAEALYHTIVDTPSLHFLIQPGGVWMQRALAMGAFAVPLGYSVKAEMAEKRKNQPPKSAGKRPPPSAPQTVENAPQPPPQAPPDVMGGIHVVPGQSTRVGVLDTLSHVPG